MGDGYVNGNENTYFRARKKASLYNEKLYSRKGAAELLGVSVSTLADYELGVTKIVPVDKVVLMADLYNCPEFKNEYCKKECPIGKTMPIATEVKGIEGVVLRFIREFDVKNIKEIIISLVEIAEDGKITEEEKPKLKETLEKIDILAVTISEVKLVGEKALKGKVK